MFYKFIDEDFFASRSSSMAKTSFPSEDTETAIDLVRQASEYVKELIIHQNEMKNPKYLDFLSYLENIAMQADLETLLETEDFECSLERLFDILLSRAYPNQSVLPIECLVGVLKCLSAFTFQSEYVIESLISKGYLEYVWAIYQNICSIPEHICIIQSLGRICLINRKMRDQVVSKFSIEFIFNSIAILCKLLISEYISESLEEKKFYNLGLLLIYYIRNPKYIITDYEIRNLIGAFKLFLRTPSTRSYDIATYGLVIILDRSIVIPKSLDDVVGDLYFLIGYRDIATEFACYFLMKYVEKSSVRCNIDVDKIFSLLNNENFHVAIAAAVLLKVLANRRRYLFDNVDLPQIVWNMHNLILEADIVNKVYLAGSFIAIAKLMPSDILLQQALSGLIETFVNILETKTTDIKLMFSYIEEAIDGLIFIFDVSYEYGLENDIAQVFEESGGIQALSEMKYDATISYEGSDIPYKVELFINKYISKDGQVNE